MGKIKFLGACKEVGGSGFYIKSGERNILLDYGIYLRRETPFPITVSPRDVDAIFVSHAHLDHTGALPLMYITGNPPLYTTKISLELIMLILNDFLNISRTPLPFEEEEIFAIRENTVKINYGDEIKLGNDFEITIIDAGHIPGSAMFLIKTPKKTILYTGDVNIRDTLLLKGAEIELPEVDYVITESTYALRNHPPREELEKNLVESITEVVENNGIVIIPAFAISRSQEILCVLEKYHVDYPIYLDGMARKVSRIFLKNPSFFRDFDLLQRAHKNVEFIKNKRQRKSIITDGGVIISPAGMMNGGAILYYASQIMDDPKNGIFIVGYQVPGSPGRVLLDEGKLQVNGETYKVKSQISYFDFSSHSGSDELFEMISKIPGNPNVIIVHGEEEACTYMEQKVREELGLNTLVPNSGDVLEL